VTSVQGTGQGSGSMQTAGIATAAAIADLLAGKLIS
jgi:hypothetical protein